MEEIMVYTDGACSGNPGPGGWAAVIIFPDNRLVELGGGEKSTTNNRMEIKAAIEALALIRRHYSIAAENPCKIKIYTDSSLLLNGITKWIWGWLKRGWVSSTGAPVANRELWEKLFVHVSALKGSLSWVHVKGHAGHEINERCDEIAVSFSKGSAAKLYSGPAIGCGYSLLPPENIENGSDSFHDKSQKIHKNEKDKFYISAAGGIVLYHKTWPECEARVKGLSNARFKKVYSKEEAEACLRAWGLK